MKHNNLTLKQEAFCQAYIKSGDASKAYREAYSFKNMKPEVIHVRACELLKNSKVSVRIAELQAIAKEVSETEFKHTISDSLKLDIEIIERYKKHIAVLENPKSTDKEIEVAKRTIHFIGIKGFDSAMDRVSKKLGFYEKDNFQKATIDFGGEFDEEKEKRLKALLEKASKLDV